MTAWVSGKAPLSAKVLAATAVAGVSMESVIVGAVVGGMFLVAQGVVQTLLSEWLKERRDSDRKRRKKARRKGDEGAGLGEHSSRGSINSDSGITPTESKKRNES